MYFSCENLLKLLKLIRALSTMKLLLLMFLLLTDMTFYLTLTLIILMLVFTLLKNVFRLGLNWINHRISSFPYHITGKMQRPHSVQDKLTLKCKLRSEIFKIFTDNKIF